MKEFEEVEEYLRCLAQKQKKTFLDAYSRICFKIKGPMPVLFFSYFVEHLKELSLGTLDIIDSVVEKESVVKSKLQTSFWGRSLFAC